VATYGVDIEIGVKGQQRLQSLTSAIKLSGKAADSLAKSLGERGVVSQSIDNYSKALQRASRTLQGVIAGTKAETKAVKEYAAALNDLIAIQERQKKLVGAEFRATAAGQAELELTKAKKSLEIKRKQGELQAQQDRDREAIQKALGRMEFEQAARRRELLAQGTRELKEQLELSRQIFQTTTSGAPTTISRTVQKRPTFGGGRATAFGPQPDRIKRLRRAEVFDRTAAARRENEERRRQFQKLEDTARGARIRAAREENRDFQKLTADKIQGKKDEIALQNALGKMEEKSRAINQNRNRLQQKSLRLGKQRVQSVTKEVLENKKLTKEQQRQLDLQKQQRRQKLGGAISSGLIGGGFPLLFGQGGAAAAGGAIGGLAGGAIGGGFGFALSIVGTALGQAIADAEEFDKSLIALNSGLDGTATSTSITASEINDLADALGRTKDETVETLENFKNLGANTQQIKNLALIFGKDAATPAALAAVEKQSDLGKIILANINKIGKTRTRQLLTQLEAGNQLEVELELVKAIAGERERQLIAEKARISLGDRFFAALAQAGAGAEGMAIGPILTPEQLRDERVARFSKKIREQLGLAVPSVTNVVQGLRELNELVDEDEGTKADPTINLQKRLNILNKQIASEQKFVGISSEGASIIRRKLASESRIAQIQEAGKAERKRLTDQEDITLSNSIQTQAIKLENLKFEREAIALIERQNKAGEKLLEPLRKKLDAIKDRNAFEKEYGELIMSGSTPAAAKQVVEAEKQKKEIDRLVEKQLESNEILIANLRIKVAETEGTKAHTAAQEALNDALERRNEIEEKGRAAKGEIKGEKTPAERIEEERRAIQGALNELNDPVNQLVSLANTLGNAFSESFRGIVDGSMSAQQALANLFQRTADHFLDMAAQMIAAQIKMKILGIGLSFFGGGGGSTASEGLNISGVQQYVTEPFNAGDFTNAFSKKALGGAVGAGRPYMVGERGPELFVPGAQGNIVPNNAMGGSNIVVNVDASGSSVEGNSDQAAQLGKMLGAAVQAELVKQKRPGGLLAS
jgi:hypothetical protein